MNTNYNLTGNQKIALSILGYLPKGHVCCAECCGGPAAGQGQIFVGKKWVASVPRKLHGGKLPQSS